ncbi:MAG: hypothetical protein AAGA27_05555, partial [Pseudomonadota bacterium]
KNFDDKKFIDIYGKYSGFTGGSIGKYTKKLEPGNPERENIIKVIFLRASLSDYKNQHATARTLSRMGYQTYRLSSPTYEESMLKYLSKSEQKKLELEKENVISEGKNNRIYKKNVFADAYQYAKKNNATFDLKLYKANKIPNPMLSVVLEFYTKGDLEKYILNSNAIFGIAMAFVKNIKSAENRKKYLTQYKKNTGNDKLDVKAIYNLIQKSDGSPKSAYEIKQLEMKYLSAPHIKRFGLGSFLENWQIKISDKDKKYRVIFGQKDTKELLGKYYKY